MVRESHQADSYPACAGQERSADGSGGDMVNAENAILEVCTMTTSRVSHIKDTHKVSSLMAITTMAYNYDPNPA